MLRRGFLTKLAVTTVAAPSIAKAVASSAPTVTAGTATSTFTPKYTHAMYGAYSEGGIVKVGEIPRLLQDGINAIYTREIEEYEKKHGHIFQ